MKSFTVNVAGDTNEAVRLAKTARLQAYSNGTTASIKVKAQTSAHARRKVIDLLNGVAKVVKATEA